MAQVLVIEEAIPGIGGYAVPSKVTRVELGKKGKAVQTVRPELVYAGDHPIRSSGQETCLIDKLNARLSSVSRVFALQARARWAWCCVVQYTDAVHQCAGRLNFCLTPTCIPSFNVYRSGFVVVTAPPEHDPWLSARSKTLATSRLPTHPNITPL